MRKWIFDRLLALALKHHKKVLIITFVFTIIMGGLAGNLKMNFRWTDLLPEDFPFVKEYSKIQENHNDYSLLIVLVNGEDREKMKQAVDDVAAAIEKRTELIKDVDSKLPYDFLEKHGFMTLKPKDAKRISKMYRDPNLPTLLANFNDDLEKTYIGGEDDLQENENEVVSSLEATSQALSKIYHYIESENPDKQVVIDIARDFTFGDGYYTSLDGKTLMVLASCTPDIVINAEKYADVAYAVEEDLQPIIAKYPGLNIEMTGMTPIGKDEIELLVHFTTDYKGNCFMDNLIFLKRGMYGNIKFVFL
jgi:predicted RND superfamily exporter protein